MTARRLPPGGVVFFDPYPHVVGGAQVVTVSVARELRRRGVEVRVVTTDEGQLGPLLAEESIPYQVVPMPAALSMYGHETVGRARARAAAAMPVAWARIGRLLTPRPAVVHATDLRGAFLAGPPARAIGVPLVWHLHLTEPEPALNWAAGLLAQVALTPSREALSVLPRRVRRRGEVLYNGLPAETLALPPARFERPLVVSAGRVSAQKGTDVLAEAAALLRARIAAVEFRVYGAVQYGWEEYDARLRRRLTELGLGRSFQLAGFVDRPARLWGPASVYVQPSRREGLPLAAVEAMAVGLPVVASAVGGLTELVDHGVNGLLVPPDDPAALACALAELLDDRERAEHMGRAARDRVARLYTVEAMVDRLLDIYSRLV